MVPTWLRILKCLVPVIESFEYEGIKPVEKISAEVKTSK